MEIKNLIYLYKLLGKENIALSEDLTNYSNFKIGGKAKVMLFPTNLKQSYKLLKFLNKKNLIYTILGNGTNALIKGDLDIVVCFKKMQKILINKNNVFAESGVSLFKLNEALAQNGLSNLEKTYGIPASVGGGIVQNCGAYGYSISDDLTKVLLFNGKKIKKVRKEKLEFSYRTSIFKNNKNFVVLGGYFKLEKVKPEEIQKKLDDIILLRKSKQPYEYPSAGSVFKRCEGVIVSKLIDELGLKGYSIGGAKISEKHSGFIINYNNATYDDVINLINFVKNKNDN